MKAFPESASLRILRCLLMAVMACGLSGFSGNDEIALPVYGKAPALSEFRKLTANLSAEPGMETEQIAALIAAEQWARAAVERVYGAVTSKPPIYAFNSEETYRRFGGGVTLARFDGDQIIISPRALKEGHFIAHEWSHAEMQQRLTFEGYLRLPAWFDEGIAVMIGDAPETSEQHWQWLMAQGIPRPSRAELLSFKTPSQWEDAIHRYGEDQNRQRAAFGEPQQRPVYTAAGQELRRWFAQAGTKGLLYMLAVLNTNQDFLPAYQQYKPGYSANRAIRSTLKP
jgi:hypothetical protein